MTLTSFVRLLSFLESMSFVTAMLAAALRIPDRSFLSELFSSGQPVSFPSSPFNEEFITALALCYDVSHIKISWDPPPVFSRPDFLNLSSAVCKKRSGNHNCLFGLLLTQYGHPVDGTIDQSLFHCAFQCIFWVVLRGLCHIFQLWQLLLLDPIVTALDSTNRTWTRFCLPPEVHHSSIALVTSIRECYSPRLPNPVGWCEASMESDLAEANIFLKELNGFFPQLFRKWLNPSVSGKTSGSSFLKCSSYQNGALLLSRCD